MHTEDDGLYCGRKEAGKWAEEKHLVVSLYAKLFATGMKEKWDERVYIELYAGAGYSRIQDTAGVIVGSPIHALTLEHPFDKYIFCEEDPKSLEALKARVKRTAPSARVAYIPGDCNSHVDDILAAIPAHSKHHRVLSLCFVDPYDIGIKFETLRRLSVKYVDFLVLLALYMDANRNPDNYAKEESMKIDEFLGSGDWRGRWKAAQESRVPFPRFLAEEFSKSMEMLEYEPRPFYKMRKVRMPQNVPLYSLALFSRHPLAYSFWDQVLKYSTPQTDFDFEQPLGE